MRLLVLSDAAAFLARAGAFLEAAEAENGLLLGLARRHLAPAPAPSELFVAAVEDDAREVRLASLRTPPHHLILSTGRPEGAAFLARELHALGATLPGVTGPRDVCGAFAERWCALRGERARPQMAQRLFRLDELVPPRPVSGAMRLAMASDADRAVAWLVAFAREAGVTVRGGERERVAGFISQGDLALWCDPADGHVVSMAAAVGRTPRGARVGAVYTPAEQRRRGYASALVGALSHLLLARGIEILTLYTDLSNPTSNAIYQRLGYRPLLDVAQLGFSSPPGA